ncbi:MAG: mannose-6-phosphate isomerase [Ruminococcaceae bacterium]|nr:mannose-6-phosphate isomerase [Oscillospiraceae bacterium]
MVIYPIKMTPCTKAAPWGGSKLSREFYKKTEFEFTGESWEASAHRNGKSVASNGEYAGCDLAELTEKFGTELLGSRVKGSEFPVLFKLIDARDKLSVQVHPDDEYARREENDNGKTEMWTVIGCEEGAGLYLGFKEPITKEEYAVRIRNNTLEEVLQFVPAELGKSYFLPAGLVHAIGAGLVIAEIQQSSDSTYRVYDWGRMGLDGKPRQLHVGKAIDVSNTSWAGSASESISVTTDACVREWLNSCEYFAAMKLTLTGTVCENTDGESFHIVFVSEGEGRVVCGGEEVVVSKGETVIIPACAGEYTLAGNMTAFRYWTADRERDYVAPLAALGFSSEAIAALCGE